MPACFRYYLLPLIALLALASSAAGAPLGLVTWRNERFDYRNFLGAPLVKIASGDAHNVALRADGTVIACGSNDEGQCNVPAGLTGVVDVVAGFEFSLALKSDGTLVGWGT